MMAMFEKRVAKEDKKEETTNIAKKEATILKLMNQKSQRSTDGLSDAYTSKMKARKTMNLLQFGNRNQQSYQSKLRNLDPFSTIIKSIENNQIQDVLILCYSSSSTVPSDSTPRPC